MKTLNNHRQLKPNEVIRKGDLFKNLEGVGIPVGGSIGALVSDWPRLNFYRRLHTKKVSTPLHPATGAAPRIKPAQTGDKHPTVTFRYKNIGRRIQVIKLDDKYLTGLELTVGMDFKPKWQFKKFLRSRLQSPPVLVKLADK